MKNIGKIKELEKLMDTREWIENNYYTLTKTEKKIANFILQDTEHTFVNMTLLELAKQLGIGEATIVRFCRKMGFDGFQNLKVSMAIENARQDEKSGSQELDHTREMEKMIRILEKTNQCVDWKKLEYAADMMRIGREIYFYGAGSSGLTAEIAEARFLRMGGRAKALKESHFQTVQSAVMGTEDVVVVISVSGTTNDLYEAVKVAKDNGAKLIAITNHENSVIAALSDCVLLTKAPENPITGGNFESVVSQLYVLDLLFSCYSARNRGKVSSYLDKIALSINNKLR